MTPAKLDGQNLQSTFAATPSKVKELKGKFVIIIPKQFNDQLKELYLRNTLLM
jgi:hypothetical protein